MKVLALDFDGVICDSGREIFLVALRTYVGMRPDSRFRERLDRLSEPDRAHAVVEDPLYREFMRLMPLGNRAEDFGVELAALEAGVEISDQADYDAFFDTLGSEFMGLFHGQFYQERRAYRGADPQHWLELMSPYSEFLEILRRRSSDVELAIATAKDRESVCALLEHFRISDLFAADRIFDKESGRSKRAHLQRVRERFGAACEDITFVDDKLNHLDSVRDLGIRCALAAWGYNGSPERRQARSKGYLVCGLTDVEQALFD